MSFEYSISGKWLELLKQIAPGVTRVAVLRDPGQASGTGQFGVMQGMAPPLRVEVSPQGSLPVQPGNGDIFRILAQSLQSRRCLLRSGGDRSTCSRQVRARNPSLPNRHAHRMAAWS
jgi:hypothetical protein